jgi:hypothetical protein
MSCWPVISGWEVSQAGTMNDSNPSSSNARAGPASLEQGQAHRPEAAEQRDELAPFQLIEVPPLSQPGAQHSRLASVKSQYSVQQCRISSRLMSEMGQNRKSSMRANVFRCSPNNGHRRDPSVCPVRTPTAEVTLAYVLLRHLHGPRR